MKISIITHTVRENPRLAEMANCIAHNLEQTKDVDVQWIVVDEKLWDEEKRDARVGTLEGLVDGRFEVVHVPAPPTEHRQPGMSLDEMGSAENAARNEALSHADGDYILVLHDCCLITPNLLKTAEELCEAELGYRVPAGTVQDWVLPPDGWFKFRDRWDNLRKVPAKVVAGLCWGAPAGRIFDAQGFDEAYDGQHKGTDVELILRMARQGLEYVTTERAYCVIMRRTYHNEEESGNAAVFRGADNLKRLTALLTDTGRVFPEQPGPMFAEDEETEAPVAPSDPDPLPSVPTLPAEDVVKAEPEAAPDPVPPSLPGVADLGDDAAEQPIAPAAVDESE